MEAARQLFSFDEYLQLEEMSPVKHEYLNGHVWAMAGGTPSHAGIAANVIAILALALQGKPCRVFTSDLRVRVRESGLGTYPDVTVVCGRLEADPDDKKGHTVTNPTVVVEVLSPSTEAYDRGEKLDHYRKVAALQEIVLVAHDRRELEVHRRVGSGWQVETSREGDAKLTSIDCVLSLDEVYRDPLAG